MPWDTSALAFLFLFFENMDPVINSKRKWPFTEVGRQPSVYSRGSAL